MSPLSPIGGLCIDTLNLLMTKPLIQRQCYEHCDELIVDYHHLDYYHLDHLDLQPETQKAHDLHLKVPKIPKDCLLAVAQLEYQLRMTPEWTDPWWGLVADLVDTRHMLKHHYMVGLQWTSFRALEAEWAQGYGFAESPCGVSR